MNARVSAAISLVLATVACATLSGAERAQQALARAGDLKAHNRLVEASAAYEEALDAEPTNLTALRSLVEIDHQIGNLPELAKRFAGILAKSAGDPYAHEGLGLALFAQGGDKAPAAEKELAKAAELAPGIADFHYRLGLVYVEGDRYEEARHSLAKAVELDGRKASYRLPYAISLARTAARAESMKQLAAVLTLDPTREEMQRAKKTAKALTDPFRGFPQAAREQLDLALGFLDHDQTAQGQQVLDSMLEHYPDLAIVHTLSGLSAAKADDTGRAIATLRKAIDLDPDLAEPRMYLGDLYFSRGRGDTAREHYEAAIQRNPFLSDAYKRLAEVHVKSTDREGAADLYRTFLLLRPDDYEATLALGKILSDLNKPEAGAVWDQALKDFPRRGELLLARGRFYFTRAATSKSEEERKRAKIEAAKSLEAAQELDPENTAAPATLNELSKLP